MFVLEESGLALDSAKLAQGVFRPLPVCLGCGKSKAQGLLQEVGEGDGLYYRCDTCNSVKPKKGIPIPGIIVRPRDNPDHRAWRQKKIREASREKALAEMKDGNARGQSFGDLLSKVGPLAAYEGLPPEVDAEGLARFVLVGWQGLSKMEGGKKVDLPYSYEVALEYLSNPAFERFKRFVLDEAGKTSAFEAWHEAEDAKN